MNTAGPLSPTPEARASLNGWIRAHRIWIEGIYTVKEIHGYTQDAFQYFIGDAIHSMFSGSYTY